MKLIPLVRYEKKVKKMDNEALAKDYVFTKIHTNLANYHEIVVEEINSRRPLSEMI